jgi:mRNA-degrading endonuclease RelE of RelBE toxin-antitoxin system
VAKVAVELDRQAQRDLRKLHPDDHRAALRAMTNVLTHEPLPVNANDRALKGRTPWRRLRVGELRIPWRAVGTTSAAVWHALSTVATLNGQYARSAIESHYDLA